MVTLSPRGVVAACVGPANTAMDFLAMEGLSIMDQVSNAHDTKVRDADRWLCQQRMHLSCDFWGFLLVPCSKS